MFKKQQLEKGAVLELALLGVVLAISVLLLVFSLQNQSAEKIVEESAPSISFVKQVRKPNIPQALYALTGSIEKIEQGAVLINATIPEMQANGEFLQKKEARKALISKETKFSQLSILLNGQNSQVIQESAIVFADLKIGDRVEVIAKTNIKNSYEFTAGQVTRLPTL